MNQYKLPLIIIAVMVFVPLGLAVLFERVQPMQIGVKQIRFGGAGIVKEDYDAGFHLGISGYHRWYFLPRATHFVHFVSSSGRGTATSMWERPLQIRTHDNNECSIEITVPYRIKQDEAHRLVEKGLRSSYKGRVKSTLEKVLRVQLAALTSEQWQDTEVRLKEARETLPILNEELAAFFVEANDILIRKVSFPPEYEEKLQEKQYFTQKAYLDDAQTQVAQQEQITDSYEKQIVAAEKQLTANWDKTFQEESSKYEVLIAEINALAKVYESRVKAEGDAEMVQLQAEGQLALDQAQALRDKLRNAALGTRGGQIFLALRAAENLEIPSVTLNSNDPRVPLVLDLDELTKVLLGAAR